MQRSTSFAFLGILGALLVFAAATGAASLVWKAPVRATRPADVERESEPEVQVEQRLVEIAFLGVSTEQRHGELVVTQVTQNTAAARAGIRPDDVIESIDDQPISESDALGMLVRSHEPGDHLSLRVKRGDEILALDAVLGRQTRTETVIGNPSVGGTLTGRVTSAQTGAPVANANVTIVSVVRSPSMSRSTTQENAKTDDDGRYTLKVARSDGALQLRVEATGFVFWQQPVAVSGEKTADVELSVDPRPLVRGEVRVAATGKLAEGTTSVRVYQRKVLGFTKRVASETATNGHFEIRLAPGRYSFVADGMEMMSKSVSLTVGSEGASVTLELAPKSEQNGDEDEPVAPKPARR